MTIHQRDTAVAQTASLMPEAESYEVHYCGFRTCIERREGESFSECKARVADWVERIAKRVSRQGLINPDSGPTVYPGKFDREFLDKEYADHMSRHVLASLWREAATTDPASANARASALAILAKHYDLNRVVKQLPAPVLQAWPAPPSPTPRFVPPTPPETGTIAPL